MFDVNKHRMSSFKETTLDSPVRINLSIDVWKTKDGEHLCRRRWTLDPFCFSCFPLHDLIVVWWIICTVFFKIYACNWMVIFTLHDNNFIFIPHQPSHPWHHILTLIALIPDLVIWVILAFEMGGLYSFNEYNWGTKRDSRTSLVTLCASSAIQPLHEQTAIRSIALCTSLFVVYKPCGGAPPIS